MSQGCDVFKFLEIDISLDLNAKHNFMVYIYQQIYRIDNCTSCLNLNLKVKGQCHTIGMFVKFHVVDHQNHDCMKSTSRDMEYCLMVQKSRLVLLGSTGVRKDVGPSSVNNVYLCFECCRIEASYSAFSEAEIIKSITHILEALQVKYINIKLTLFNCLICVYARQRFQINKIRNQQLGIAGIIAYWTIGSLLQK